MTNFVWPAHFACTVITDQTILPNSYSLNICVEPINSKANINTGFRKLRYFVENYLHNSVFMSENNELFEKLESIENTKVIFPDNPYDFIVGSILLAKFISISEKYFDIGYITIESAISDHVQYTITDPDDSGLEIQGDYWWNKDSPTTGLNIDTTWEELNLKDTHNFSPMVIKGGLEK